MDTSKSDNLRSRIREGGQLEWSPCSKEIASMGSYGVREETSPSRQEKSREDDTKKGDTHGGSKVDCSACFSRGLTCPALGGTGGRCARGGKASASCEYSGRSCSNGRGDSWVGGVDRRAGEGLAVANGRGTNHPGESGGNRLVVRGLSVGHLDAVGGVDTRGILVLSFAGLENISLRCSGAVEVHSKAIEDVLAVTPRIGTSGVTNFEAEAVSTDEAEEQSDALEVKRRKTHLCQIGA